MQENRPIILIVEDDQAVATLEQRRLERAGYSVITAPGPAEAMALLARHRFALILLDYRLPGDVDGLTFYQQVKDAGYDLPVILVTGFGNEAVVIRALRDGVRDFVTKSTEYLDYLPEAVARVLKQIEIERQLIESEARLTAVIASAKDAILVAESDRRITLFNTAAEEMFRCSAKEALGQSLNRFLPPDIEEPDPSKKDQSLSMQVRSRTRGLRANGEEFPVEASVSRVDRAGRHLYAVVVRDVTERQNAEKLLREQATLLEKAQDAILIRNLDGRISFWNRGAERLYGWTAAEAIGREADRLLFNNKSPLLAEANAAIAARGEWSGELGQVDRRGREVWVNSSWTLVRDDATRPNSVLIINTNVSERKELEMQLLHAKRLESIGRLAGGVAHDFNNLLTVITGYCDMLLATAQLPDSSANFLHEIKKASDRAAGLTRQLLAFSRKQILAPRLLDVNTLVHDAENLLRRLIGEHIELTTVLTPGLWPVRADPVQLEQVIINLVVNSRDAMPKGGRLRIETGNARLDAAYAQKHLDVRPGHYVRLAVADTGVGMDQATRAQIFEPFFTTKEIGKGTGLGLATVYGVVKQSGGHVDVDSEPGRGATFQIYLPAAVGAPEADVPIAGPFQAYAGTGSVLLVEDEEGVRELARLALQTSGYTTQAASDGFEALAMARSRREPFDLLVTDVVMPKMSGRELAAEIKALSPGIQLLFLSGYTDDAVVHSGLLERGAEFLHKPFTPLTLVRKVHELLNRPKSESGALGAAFKIPTSRK